LPGWVDTDLTQKARDQVQGLHEKVLARTPAGRWGEPDDLAGRDLLYGWRGGPVLDQAELGHAIAALGDLIASHPQLTEAEINPLRLTTDGLVALDAVIVACESAKTDRS